MTKYKITDDEKQTFQDAMEGVKRYSVKKEKSIETHVIEPHSQKTIPKLMFNLRQDKSRLTKRPLPPQRTELHRVTGHDIISFAKTGLQHKKFSQLKQEKIKIEATLDLHEHTSDEALIATDHFIERCQNKGFRAVCIIHGKGLYSSDNNPVLKNLLNSYLRGHESVIAFHSSKNNTGSMIVLLKYKA
ncbi:MAG: Smr/MutS family protein [Coxiellaceae bacterium]|nr:Smr/MutS family protein [Coxiellaceae bacterium]